MHSKEQNRLEKLHEEKTTQQFSNFANSLAGVECVRHENTPCKGYADIEMFVKGVGNFFIEVKKTNGNISKAQLKWAEIIYDYTKKDTWFIFGYDMLLRFLSIVLKNKKNYKELRKEIVNKDGFLIMKGE